VGPPSLTFFPILIFKGALMNNDSFQAFIDLVDFDRKSFSLQAEIEKAKKDIEDLNNQKIALEEGIKDVKENLHQIQKDVDGGELEMKDIEQQVASKKKRLDDVSNQKEYVSLTHEIENLQNKQHEMEEPLLTAWNKLEQAKQDVKTKDAEFDKKMAEIVDLIEKDEKKIDDLQIQLEAQAKEREEKEKLVKPEWLEKYAVMRAQVQNPVVPVEQGSCSACFYDVTSQRLIELKKNKVVQCKGCYRFLYLKSEEE